jgi:ABC-2 type transporter
MYQFLLVLKRNFIVYLRAPGTSIVKILVPLAVGGLVSWMFHGVSGTFMGVRNRNGVLFFTDAAIGFIAMQFTALVFPYERPIMLRELGNNMYSVGPYFLGRYCAELPSCIIVPAIFGSIIYWVVGLATNFWWKFPLFSKIDITP